MDSIFKNIAYTLIYCAYTKKLWDEIEERYHLLAFLILFFSCKI